MNLTQTESTQVKDKIDNWRDEALDAALKAEAGSGQGMDAILHIIRQRRPGCATLLLWPDRLQLRRFLDEHAGGFQSLVRGQDGHIERDEFCPYLGWYGASWQDNPVEVALSPGTYVSSGVVLIADDIAALQSFATALEEYTQRPQGRSLRYSGDWESAPELDAELAKVTWEDVVLAPELMDSVRTAVDGFFAHRDAYAALGFPWRRGLLLVGPPGTGKTMICKAAANALPGLPFLYVRDFSESEGLRSDAITAIFERARKLAPCLLAFEDIDGLVNEMNRTVFLNELDGFRNNEGLLIIASSNHPERIDEALLKRPSRFDRVYHVGLPGPAERRAYCERLLSRSELSGRVSTDLDVPELSRRVAERSHDFTPAYLKEAFVAAALKRAQEGALVLDAAFGEAVLEQVEELRTHLRRLRDPEAMREFAAADSDGMGIRKR